MTGNPTPEADSPSSTPAVKNDGSLRRWQRILLLLVLFAGVLVQALNPRQYKLSAQHDPQFHLQGYRQLLEEDFLDYYSPPLYLAWYRLHSLVTYPNSLGWVWSWYSEIPLRVVVGLGNFNLFIILLIGVWRLAGYAGVGRDQKLAWLAITVSLPPLHRSLNMIRPENIQLALTPWVLLFALEWWDSVRRHGFRVTSLSLWLFVGSASLVVFQKITGIVILAACFLAFLIRAVSEPSRTKFRAIVLGTLLTTTLITSAAIAWRLSSGWWIYEHHASDRPSYQSPPPVAFFYSFPVEKLWEKPYRNHARGSFWGILALDLFGDYWRYGWDHYIKGPSAFEPGSQEEKLDTRDTRRRIGFVTSLSFALFWFLGSLSTIRTWVMPSDPDDRIGMLSKIGAILVVASLATLAAASIKFFNPGKADTVKWEYIVFCLPFLSLPAAAFFEGKESLYRRVIAFSLLLALCLVGLYQSRVF